MSVPLMLGASSMFLSTLRLWLLLALFFKHLLFSFLTLTSGRRRPRGRARSLHLRLGLGGSSSGVGSPRIRNRGGARGRSRSTVSSSTSLLAAFRSPRTVRAALRRQSSASAQKSRFGHSRRRSVLAASIEEQPMHQESPRARDPTRHLLHVPNMGPVPTGKPKRPRANRDEQTVLLDYIEEAPFGSEGPNLDASIFCSKWGILWILRRGFCGKRGTLWTLMC